MKPVILVGPRCAGKTTVGRELAALLSVPFMDCDNLFVERHGGIIEFLHENGWETFREYESQIIYDVVSRFKDKSIVFAPGGGTVAHEYSLYRQRNVKLLRNFGRVIYLLPDNNPEVNIEILAERMQKDEKTALLRPRLTSEASILDEVRKTYIERDPFYRLAAHEIVYTEGDSSPKVTAMNIADIFDCG